MNSAAQDTPATGMTIAQARRAMSDAFRKAGLDTPELDARVLAGHVRSLDHTGLATESMRRIDAEAAHTLTELAERRLRREPVARRPAVPMGVGSGDTAGRRRCEQEADANEPFYLPHSECPVLIVAGESR